MRPARTPGGRRWWGSCYFPGDTGPGEITCQDVCNFGELVVNPQRQACALASSSRAERHTRRVIFEPGDHFPDLDLPDHTGRQRTLLELAGGDPLALLTSRGWWCPKEQRHLRELTRLQDEFEVAYARIAVVSVDPQEVQAALRAGLGARFTFLSDAERRWLERLGMREVIDTVHDPYVPAAFTLFPDLRVHRSYNGYYYWGRPTMEELRRDMREISRELRPDWEPPTE